MGDPTGGVVLLYTREVDQDQDLLAQYLTSKGRPGWGGSILTLCEEPYDQLLGPYGVDGLGNIVTCWKDWRDHDNPSIYAQYFTFDGEILWSAPGEAMSTVDSRKSTPGIVVRPAGGAIAFWTDDRNGAWDLYCDALNEWGPVSSHPKKRRRPGLLEARPNPFNPRTTVAFELTEPALVNLQVFDLSGRRVRTLLSGESYVSGTHEAVWDGTDDAGRQVASGTYLCRLQAGAFSQTNRVMLIR